MAEIEPVRPYRYLHRPYRILWFETEEIALLFMGFIFALVVSIWLLIPFVVTTIIVRKVKKKMPRGFLKHLFYFAGYYRFPGAPTAHEKTFQE